MNYYYKHIGDYHKKAGKLSMLEHGAYNLLLDACHDREIFPTEEEAIDWVWARSADEIAAVRFVLSRFFVPTDDGRAVRFVQTRVAETLEGYWARCKINAENARKGGRPTSNKKSGSKASGNDLDIKKTDSLFDDSESLPNRNPDVSLNHKPITNNQKPTTGKSNLFDLFWAAGMRKDNKKGTEKIFNRLLKRYEHPEAFVEMLVDDIKKRLEANQFGFDKLLPSTYLNNERWKDVIEYSNALPEVAGKYKPGGRSSRDIPLADELTNRGWATAKSVFSLESDEQAGETLEGEFVEAGDNVND